MDRNTSLGQQVWLLQDRVTRLEQHAKADRDVGGSMIASTEVTINELQDQINSLQSQVNHLTVENNELRDALRQVFEVNQQLHQTQRLEPTITIQGNAVTVEELQAYLDEQFAEAARTIRQTRTQDGAA